MKSLNILLATSLEDATNNGIPDVKLCDFGLSRRLGPHGDAPKSDFGTNELLWGTTVDMDPNAVAGTFAYLAPECFERPASTPEGMKSADVFALGVVLWELATCDVPWAGLTIGALMRVVREKRTLPFPDRVRDHVGNGYVDLVKKCWSHRPDATTVAVELEALYETISPRSGAEALLSDVSINSTVNRGVMESLFSESSLTSDESAAIASITSVDDDMNDPEFYNGSFDISLTLFPDYAREIAEKRRMEQAETEEDSGESDSDTSVEFDNVEDWDDDNDEDVVVFGNVDDLVDVPLQSIEASKPSSPQVQPSSPVEPSPRRESLSSDISTPYSSSAESEEEDEFLEFGQVVEIEEDYKSPVVSGSALQASTEGKRVHFGETLTTTIHVSASHQEQQQASPLAPHSPKKQGKMAEQDGLYYPEEFSGAGPGFLDATNELSEFSFTFQDGASHEGPLSSSSRTTHAGSRLKENIAESLQRRQSLVKSAERRELSPPSPKRPTTAPPRYSPMRPPKLPIPATRKSPVRHPELKPRTPVLRDYSSPPIQGTALNQELARFEDEDANNDVLTSVLQFSRFVQRRY